MTFYGTSFIADPFGEIVAESKTKSDEIIAAEIDLNKGLEMRDILQFHRDRRPDSYGELLRLSMK